MEGKTAGEYCRQRNVYLKDVAAHYDIDKDVFRRWFTHRPKTFKTLVNQYARDFGRVEI